jgi:hypothetical protein
MKSHTIKVKVNLDFDSLISQESKKEKSLFNIGATTTDSNETGIKKSGLYSAKSATLDEQPTISSIKGSIALKKKQKTEFKIDENGVLTYYGGANEEVVIPDGVVEIGEYAFCGDEDMFHGIRSVVIPAGVKTIGKLAFSGQHNLEQVTLPKSLEKIGDKAFFFCDSLNTIIIPDSCIVIGSEAFSCCDSLKTVIIPDGCVELGDECFCCEKLTDIYIPASVTTINGRIFGILKEMDNDFTIHTVPGSKAEEYAKDHRLNLSYEAI